MRRGPLLLLCLAAAALPALASPAVADVFEPIQLVSASPTQQADYARHAAISGDARYVAFDGSFGGVFGVWRRSLLTGAVTAVAACAPEERCAELPSISEGGRYVSFTTTSALDPKNDTNGAPDVYVRDMNSSTPCFAERGEAETCEYTLASAKSGSSAGLVYAYSGNPALEATRYGSLASGRSALSADGRHVAFETTAESDLHGEHTPPLQVAVRDLPARTTRLVSVRYDPATGGTTEEPVPTSEGGSIGSVYPGGSSRPFLGTAEASSGGASISADGSTVAWMAQEIERQVPLLSAERYVSPVYTEPLWRRIADGPLAPIRRVTGGSDAASSACVASGEQALANPATLSDPCQGPFDPTYLTPPSGIWILGPGEGDYLPRLSANGQVLAFLSSAREVASGEPFNSAEASTDLYVVDMRNGLTRVQALRRLTELAGGNTSERSRTAPITDLGVSADGSQIAFATRRTVFPLGSPAFVSAPAAEAGAIEIFNVDLANDTLTRVTHGFRGEPSEPAGAVSGSPSFSSDGNTLAFSSTANNLVYGDGNGPPGGKPNGVFDGSDAFISKRKILSPTPAETYISQAPAGPALNPEWRLFVTAHSRRDGSVVLDVLVPGAGSLSAHAQGVVSVSVGSHAAKRGRARRTHTILATRTVANALTLESEAGLVELRLKLAQPYGVLADRRGGLPANALLSFTAPGHGVARQSIEVSFVRLATSARKARKAAHRHRQHGGGGRR
jgi:hypothetical protein